MDDRFSWWKLINENHNYINSVPIDVLQQFTDWDKALLIAKHPSLFESFDTTAFSGETWHFILCGTPSLAEYANWSLISAKLKKHLIEVHPELITYYLVHI